MSKEIYIEDKIFNSILYKKKQKKRNKYIIQIDNYHFWNSWKLFTSHISFWLSQIIAFTTCGQSLAKIWKAKTSVKFLILLLQISYIFIACMKALNVLQKSTENQTFCHKPYPFTNLRMHGLSTWQCSIDSSILILVDFLYCPVIF